MTEQELKNKQMVGGLRAVADFYAAHPGLKAPWGCSNLSYGDAITFWVKLEVGEHEQLRDWVRAFGSFTKNASASTFQIEKSLGSAIMQVELRRDAVCTPKIVGKKKVTKRVPATFAEVEEEE